MALADYFHRSAVATAQVLAGFDEQALSERLGALTVELSLGDLSSHEAQSLAELTTRLLSRFYPRLKVSGGGTHRATYLRLARAINPNIELSRQSAQIGIAIGPGSSPTCTNPIYAGSDGWDAHVGSEEMPIGSSRNPFGAGAAACLATGELFRRAFEVGDPLGETVVLSTLDLEARRSQHNLPIEGADVKSAVLVGIGAIGNATVWALSKAPVTGELHLVDGQELELSNLQRYVLGSRKDVGRAKVELAKRFLSSGLRPKIHQIEWIQFAARGDHRWEQVLVALDSAQGRRDVQAALPGWIANAWTQPGDLGVSVHPWTERGACLACLYLPAGAAPGEDRMIGEALGLTGDMELLQVRRLLHAGSPLPQELHQHVAAHLGVDLAAVTEFADRPLREFYVEGLCGGAILPLGRIGHPSQEVHVPVAHQSALAGVLLAGRLVARAIGRSPDDTSITRIDVLRGVNDYMTQPREKDQRGICVCQDVAYRTAYRAKYQQA